MDWWLFKAFQLNNKEVVKKILRLVMAVCGTNVGVVLIRFLFSMMSGVKGWIQAYCSRKG